MNEARISFEGNIGSEPELRFLPSGQAICKFSVAVNQRKKVGDEWKDTNTTWYRVAVWGRMAEAAVELKKGSKVLVVGTVIGESWEKDGKSGYSQEVSAESIAVCLSLQTARPAQATSDPWANQTASSDSAPF